MTANGVDLKADRATHRSPQKGASDSLLAVNDLHVMFSTVRGPVRAVNGVSFAVPEHGSLGIIGESGSGKSVTARAIMGLLPSRIASIEMGTVRLRGEDLVALPEKQMRQRRGRDIAMIFQDPMRALNPTMTVGGQIVEAIRAHDRRISRRAARVRAIELLESVRLTEPRRQVDAYPHRLSGGMRQRACIAMALSGEPSVLIADEPTTALDVTTQVQILDLLRELQERLGMALILITHDLGVAASYTDEVAVMYAGRIVEQAPTERLFAAVRMPYTKGLLDSIPDADGARSDLLAIPGAPPDLAEPPTGCAFHPRCAFAQGRCRVDAPPLVEDPPGHRFACWFPLEPTSDSQREVTDDHQADGR